MNFVKWPWRRAGFAAIFLAVTSGCAFAPAVFGVGASAGVSHSMNGTASRTFTAPMPKVKTATLAAFDRMGMKVGPPSMIESDALLTATATGRVIEVQLEPLTEKATRVRAVVKNGILFDSATAAEIILQTEKALSDPKRVKG